MTANGAPSKARRQNCTYTEVSQSELISAPERVVHPPALNRRCPWHWRANDPEAVVFNPTTQAKA